MQLLDQRIHVATDEAVAHIQKTPAQLAYLFFHRLIP
jgi:hypothetical protein